MVQEAKLDKEERPSISKTKDKDASCPEWLRKCCCCFSDNMDAPSTSNEPLPQTGSPLPKDIDQSKKYDGKIVEQAKNSNGSTPRPKSDEEKAPAPATQAPQNEKEDEQLTSRGSVKTEGMLKPSDTGKTHIGKGLNYDNALGSPQATRATRRTKKEIDDKHPLFHGLVKPNGEFKPGDTAKIHDQGYNYDNSDLVSPQATKPKQMIKKEREDDSLSSHGSVLMPKGELKPIDTVKVLHSKGYEDDATTLVSPQASKDIARNSKQQIESQQVSRDSKRQRETTHHQEASRGTKGKRDLVDGDNLEDDRSKSATTSSSLFKKLP